MSFSKFSTKENDKMFAESFISGTPRNKSLIAEQL